GRLAAFLRDRSATRLGHRLLPAPRDPSGHGGRRDQAGLTTSRPPARCGNTWPGAATPEPVPQEPDQTECAFPRLLGCSPWTGAHSQPPGRNASMTTEIAASAPARAAAGAALAIEAHDLVKTYPKEVRALDGLSFAVPAGTVFALLGPNGAGKSTAVKILTTLAQADSGTARVAGLDVRAKPARVRHLIGVVAQLSGADPAATGRENVMLSGRIQGRRGRDLARRTDELLGRFGLADAAGRRVRAYSGGMRRRLDAAMGLVNRPEVLFLDEPTAGLDPESRSAMWK